MSILSIPANIQLEPWQPDGVVVHEGDPRGRGATLIEREQDGRFFGAYVFACEPSRTSYFLEYDETLHVLEGQVRIELDNGTAVELGPGDSAFLPRGQQSHWTFRTPFREFAIVNG